MRATICDTGRHQSLHRSRDARLHPGCAHDPCPGPSEERPREAERRQAPHLNICARGSAARAKSVARPPPGAPPRRFWVVGPRLQACADRAANPLQRCSSRPGRRARRAEPQNPREPGGRARTRRRPIRRPDFPEAPAAGVRRRSRDAEPTGPLRRPTSPVDVPRRAGLFNYRTEFRGGDKFCSGRRIGPVAWMERRDWARIGGAS
jgi:hypothetical protein